MKYKLINKFNKDINQIGGIDFLININFYAHALLEEESSAYVGNNIRIVRINLYTIFETINNTDYLYKLYTDFNEIFINYHIIDNYYVLDSKLLTESSIKIIPLGVEKHAISLIIDNNNKHIIIVNTGYKCNNQCFTIFEKFCYANFFKLFELITIYIKNINKHN